MNLLKKLKTSVLDTLKNRNFFNKINNLRSFLWLVALKRYAEAVTTFRRFKATSVIVPVLF